MFFSIDIWGLLLLAVVLLLGVIMGKFWGHKKALASFLQEQQRIEASKVWIDRLHNYKDMEAQNET